MLKTSAVGVACLLLVSGCQSSERQMAPLPPGPQIVDVAMTEYSFDYDRTISAGRVLFRVMNTGNVVHSLNVLPLSDDIPPIDQQVRGDQRLAVRPFAGVAALEPGATTTFAVDLAPDVRYAFLCFRADDLGVSHLRKGMTSEFRTAKLPGPLAPGAPSSQRSGATG